MPSIRIMSDDLSNKIAAGEVVDRPSSVVKELVENAIDANSSSIEVYIEEGGLNVIKVIDNGKGMDREDSQLAFQRHATSKLTSEADLFRISTLGFRGEALPSIAAVAKVTLQTWNGEESTGTNLVIEDGEIKQLADAPLRQGTIIEIKELFYNTPARYKYLRTVHTELSHITDYMNRLALAYPEISFKLFHHDRLLLQTNGNNQRLSVMAAIYGHQTAKQLIPLSASHIDFSVEGYIGKPELSRSGRQYMSVIINGRYVRSVAINQAIIRAYHTLLPIHRYPVVVLSLTMDASLIDVNVHPAKLEVRLSKEKELIDWLEAEIKQTLHKQRLIPEHGDTRSLKKTSAFIGANKAPSLNRTKLKSEQQQFDLRLPPRERLSGLSSESSASNASGALNETSANASNNNEALRSSSSETSINDASAVRETTFNESFGLSEKIQQTEVIQQTETFEHTEGNAQSKNEKQVKESTGQHTGKVPQSQEGIEQAADSSRIPFLEPIAQLHGTYILAQNENGLYMIDQHAAQERIWYERYAKQLNEPERVNQELAIPIVLEYTSGEYTLIKENAELLSQVGLFLEDFGHHSYIIRSHPQWFPQGEEESLIREVIDYVIQQKGKIQWMAFRDEVAMMMSCKKAIKANRYLTKREMEALVDELRLSSNPFTCPHGRPITVLLSKYEIEKMFKRVMS